MGWYEKLAVVLLYFVLGVFVGLLVMPGLRVVFNVPESAVGMYGTIITLVLLVFVYFGIHHRRGEG